MKDSSSLDNILLERVKKGDKDAFGILFRRYYARLCAYASLFVHSRDISEEIVMNLFADLWEKGRFGNIKSMQSYLFRSVRNACLNWLRDRNDTVQIDDCLSELVENVDSDLEIRELNRFIEEAVMSLPDRCRIAFLNSREGEMSHKEIAERMQISTKAVEKHITRALRTIKEYIAKNS